MCAGAIVMAGVDSVVFGAEDAAAGCTGSVYSITEDPAFGHFIPAYGGVMEEECAALLRRFFAQRRSEEGRHEAEEG